MNPHLHRQTVSGSSRLKLFPETDQRSPLTGQLNGVQERALSRTLISSFISDVSKQNTTHTRKNTHTLKEKIYNFLRGCISSMHFEYRGCIWSMLLVCIWNMYLDYLFPAFIWTMYLDHVFG